MPSTSAPFGLRPIRHMSNSSQGLSPVVLNLSKTLTEGLPTMYQNQPVLIDTDGNLANIANATDSFIGVFAGIEYTDLASGRPVYANNWQNGTSVKDLGSMSGKVTFYRDPNIIYEIQGTAALAAANLGEQLTFNSFTSGNSTTGFSSIAADSTTVGTAQDSLRIIGISQNIDNDWTDTYPSIEVMIARHQDVALVAGY